MNKHCSTTSKELNVDMLICFRLEYTFRTVFWALFGLSDARKVEIGQGYNSRFTESVGYIVFGVYNWAVVIVLLNMLIAMMTRSFEKITVSTAKIIKQLFVCYNMPYSKISNKFYPTIANQWLRFWKCGSL